MRKFRKFVLGAFLGGLVGSTLALLYAPTKGENARQEIVEYFTHLKDEMNRAADEKREELTAQLEMLRSGK